jgi:hypothetical protein
MSIYYPQGSLTLRIRWEDFGETQNLKLQDVYKISAVARRFTVNINDYTQADTFDAEIDYKQFPFDPRAIRSCGVTISVQDMKKVYQTNNALEVIEPNSENTIFQGFADTESIAFDDTKRTVKLEGRDFTSLLIDRKYLNSKPIDLGKPIDVLIGGLLVDLPELELVTVENRTDLETLPTLAEFAPDFNPLGTSKNTKKDETYWEVIQDIIARAGLIAFIELDKLVISKPRALYNAQKAIQFVYGKNIKNLEYKRKLGRKKNFNVKVRSLAPHKKDQPVISAEIPLEATDEWSSSIGVPKERIKIPTINADGSKGQDKDAPIISFLIPNIYDQKRLVEIGQEIYEELGRQQIEGSFETQEMEAMNGLLTCFNLIKLRNGTPLKIEIDQGDMLGLAKIKSRSEKAAFLTSRCFDPRVAVALADTLSNPRFHSPFYTKAVQFTLDSDTGFKLKVDFINFIEVPPRLRGEG